MPRLVRWKGLGWRLAAFPASAAGVSPVMTSSQSSLGYPLVLNLLLDIDALLTHGRQLVSKCPGRHPEGFRRPGPVTTKTAQRLQDELKFRMPLGLAEPLGGREGLRQRVVGLRCVM